MRTGMIAGVAVAAIIMVLGASSGFAGDGQARDSAQTAVSAPDSPGLSRSQAEEKALAISGGGRIVSCSYDYDDGRANYEIEILKDGWEHDIELDATSGMLLEHDVERR